MSLERGLKKLEAQFNENPLQVIAIGSLAATGVAKLINAIATYKGRKTWDREVDRRIKKERKR